MADKELQPISIRKTKLADAGKVRYRVYSSATEFVAVIAESALMALRVSGVKEPVKVVRDLPMGGVTVDAPALAAKEETPEKATFTLREPVPPVTLRTAELAPNEKDEAPNFVPLGIADLQRKGGTRARILSPDMVTEIIESHQKEVAKQQPTPQPYVPPPAEAEVPVPASTPAAETPPEPLSPEALSALAHQVLPETPKQPDTKEEAPVLSPEEVEKLLNE